MSVYVEGRCNLSLNTKCSRGEVAVGGGGVNVDDKSQCQIGWLIRKKEEVGRGGGEGGERERERTSSDTNMRCS